MQRKLTITVSDEVYRGLYHRVDRREISRFIEDLVRPHVVIDSTLEEEYREAARDEQAEREAREWIEAHVAQLPVSPAIHSTPTAIQGQRTMAEEGYKPVPPRRLEVRPGSDLDVALSEAEAAGAPLELVHGDETYWLVPTTAPIEELDRAGRKALVAHTRARRDRQKPLGITTAQLIREGRGENDD